MIRLAFRLLAGYRTVKWALVDQAMISGVNFLTGILLARYLGLEEFGRYVLAWMVVMFVNGIQNAAIISPMMSIGPKQPKDEAPAYYGAIIVQQLILCFAVFALVYMGVRSSAVVFPDWRVEGFALPLASVAFALQLQDFLRRYFFTRGRPLAAFANDAIRYLGQIAVLIWLFLSIGDSMDSATVLWVVAVMAAIAVVCGALIVGRLEMNAETLIATTIRHWHYSKWLMVSILVQWVSGSLFTIFPGAILGATAVGAMRAAQNLMAVTHIFTLGMENIVPVRAAEHFHTGGKKALWGYLKRATLFGGITTAVVGAVAAIAPNYWLSLVFGDQYAGYGFLLRWWAIIYLMNYLALPLHSGLRAIEDTRSIFRTYLWTALFSLIAAYPMVEYFGLNGAMSAMFVLVIIMQCLLIAAALRNKIIFIGYQNRDKKPRDDG